jgi:hypothetical protein
MPDKERFSHAIQHFDALNANDPNKVNCDGVIYAKELLYAQRMTDCLKDFAPDASEALKLAARAQHISRWKIPRSDFPLDRKGYLLWRNQLKSMHAVIASEILAAVGYDSETILRVQSLIQKKQLKQDPEVQTLEDVICLVFLQYYLEEFAEKKPPEKVIEILQKTWRKMSQRGQSQALSLPLSDISKAQLKKAIS